MCSIIGYFGKNAFNSIIRGLTILKKRGMDNFGYYDGRNKDYATSPEKLKYTNSNTIIGHNLHAIVGNIKQPIIDKDVLVINGEIYNWQDLNKKYKLRAKNDSSLVLKLLQRIGLNKTLSKLNGVYALAYWKNNKIFLARDIIGIKPIWYSKHCFASEKKAIPNQNMIELNPREIIIYNLKTNTITKQKRNFIELKPNKNNSKLYEKLVQAIKIRIPKKKFGLLFSGGVDSVVIAKILKDLGADFTCYTAAASKDSPDLIFAKKAAKALGFKLKTTIVPEIEKYLKTIVPLIEDSNVIKVGVALPIFLASKLASEDNCKVIFSGSGADELFGGYARYKKSISTLNKDCYSDILKIYEKNSYRDDVVTMYNGLELRVPFLDKNIVKYSLNINPKLKISGNTNKVILRKIADKIKIPTEFAYRGKKAAQYGSGFDKVIKKLSKNRKSSYLKQFYTTPNLKLGALISTGKDGLYAAYLMTRHNYEISCIINIQSHNKDSYMFHTPNVNLIKLQAKSMNTPLIIGKTKGKKELELKDLENTIKKAKQLHKIEGIVTGALYSNYQRERIEKICDKLGLKIFSPLWHMDQKHEMQSLLKNNFQFIMVSIAAFGLNKKWLGKIITVKDIEKLVTLNAKIGFNIAGEGGEFESLVLDCPLFNKKIQILSYEIIEENENTAKIQIKKAKLMNR